MHAQLAEADGTAGALHHVVWKPPSRLLSHYSCSSVPCHEGNICLLDRSLFVVCLSHVQVQWHETLCQRNHLYSGKHLSVTVLLQLCFPVMGGKIAIDRSLYFRSLTSHHVARVKIASYAVNLHTQKPSTPSIRRYWALCQI